MNEMNQPEERVQQALDAWRSASQRAPRPDAQERARGALLASLQEPQPTRQFSHRRGVLAFMVLAASVLLLIPGHTPVSPQTAPTQTATSLPANEISLAASYIRQAPSSQHPQQLLTAAATLLSRAHQKLPANHSATIWKEWEGTQQELVNTEHEVETQGSHTATQSKATPESSASSVTSSSGETQSPTGATGDTGGDSGQGN